jgi:hypothetical protein
MEPPLLGSLDAAALKTTASGVLPLLGVAVIAAVGGALGAFTVIGRRADVAHPSPASDTLTNSL